jgi:hypothetical protein
LPRHRRASPRRRAPPGPSWTQNPPRRRPLRRLQRARLRQPRRGYRRRPPPRSSSSSSRPSDWSRSRRPASIADRAVPGTSRRGCSATRAANGSCHFRSQRRS